jgi:hypothetical protein
MLRRDWGLIIWSEANNSAIALASGGMGIGCPGPAILWVATMRPQHLISHRDGRQHEKATLEGLENPSPLGRSRCDFAGEVLADMVAGLTTVDNALHTTSRCLCSRATLIKCSERKSLDQRSVNRTCNRSILTYNCCRCRFCMCMFCPITWRDDAPCLTQPSLDNCFLRIGRAERLRTFSMPRTSPSIKCLRSSTTWTVSAAWKNRRSTTTGRPWRAWCESLKHTATWIAS